MASDGHDEGISFNDMELQHIQRKETNILNEVFPGPPAQGTDYAKMGIRDHDLEYLPNCQAEHERARREGSKG